MTWARFDDGYAQSPKIIGLTDKAFRLHVTAICYAAQMMTDGFIPEAAPRFWQLTKAIPELVGAGLLEVAQGGWAVHDFLEYNPSREQVLNERATATEQRRLAGKASGQARRERAAERNANETGTGRSHSVEPRPDPSRPVELPSGSSATAALSPEERDVLGELTIRMDKWMRKSPDMEPDYIALLSGNGAGAVRKAIEQCNTDNVPPWPQKIRERLPKAAAKPAGTPLQWASDIPVPEAEEERIEREARNAARAAR
jgi:hypothetical protein